MKFTDGNWLLQPGVTAAHPAEAGGVQISENGFTVHAPCKRILHRGDTLSGPVLTIAVSSPGTDILCVHISHWQSNGAAVPAFSLNSVDDADVSVDASPAAVSIRSGALSLRIPRGERWRMEFSAGGRLLTSSDSAGIGKILLADGREYMHEQLRLGVGEYVYGLGERFTALVKNGQVVESWNLDGGSGSDQAYKAIPFYLTNRGYGVFVNSPDHVSFEVASEKVSRLQFSVPGRDLEYFVIYGPTPAEILSKYTALTGRPALPPAWSFGLWLTTSFTTSYDEATVTGFIDGMQERGLPLHVFHFDCFWMKGFHWCNFLWDEDVFPDPAGFIARLKARASRPAPGSTRTFRSCRKSFPRLPLAGS